MVSSNLEIVFLNAKLNMAAGISSSPVSLALLGGNAKVKSVCSLVLTFFAELLVKRHHCLSFCLILIEGVYLFYW